MVYVSKIYPCYQPIEINSLIPEQDGRHFADGISIIFSFMTFLYFDKNFVKKSPVDDELLDPMLTQMTYTYVSHWVSIW